MPEQVELAKQRGLSAHIFVGDIAALDLPAEKFDAVFTFGVFHHVPEWTRALQEVYRVLKPGGALLGGELQKERTIGFEWPGFAQDLEKIGFHIVESRKIYLGYFVSFMCVKPSNE
jgi:ubiquinone/menaquinone biosynthesis C-methylase UbiE